MNVSLPSIIPDAVGVDSLFTDALSALRTPPRHTEDEIPAANGWAGGQAHATIAVQTYSSYEVDMLPKAQNEARQPRIAVLDSAALRAPAAALPPPAALPASVFRHS